MRSLPLGSARSSCSHSTAEEFHGYEAQLSFAVIADPDRRFYQEFGVESTPRAVLDPRAWPATLRGLLHTLGAILTRRQRIPSLHQNGGHLGLPADLLIAPDGRVLACKYGAHAYEQWSVDELLAHAGTAPS